MTQPPHPEKGKAGTNTEGEVQTVSFRHRYIKDCIIAYLFFKTLTCYKCKVRIKIKQHCHQGIRGNCLTKTNLKAYNDTKLNTTLLFHTNAVHNCNCQFNLIMILIPGLWVSISSKYLKLCVSVCGGDWEHTFIWKATSGLIYTLLYEAYSCACWGFIAEGFKSQQSNPTQRL